MDPFSAISSVIGNVIQARQSRRNIDSQARHNRELADRQYGHQLDMWNRMNEYNAPVAQMERYKEAGLNPHLIYGKGGSAGNATTMPQYQEQTTDYSQRKAINPASMLAQYHSLSLAREKAIQANATSQVEASTGGIQDRQQILMDEQLSAQYQREMLELQLNKEEANAEYYLQLAENKFLLSNKAVTKAELDNKFKKLQINAAQSGRTYKESALIRGWTDILNNRLLTEDAKTVYLASGMYGADILKDVIPASILKGVFKAAGKGSKVEKKNPTVRTTTRYDAKGKIVGSSRTRTRIPQHRE